MKPPSRRHPGGEQLARQGAALPDSRDRRDGDPVYLARNGWDLGRVQEDFPQVRFTATRERH